MKRRQFLKMSSQAGLAAGLSQLLPLASWAQSAQAGRRTRYLVTIHMMDGADVTLGLDPQVKSANVSDTVCFLGYRADEIVQAGNLRLGPAAASLAPYANQSIVINGVSMLGNISHDDCRRMAQTGIIDRRTPQIVSLKSYAEAGGSAARAMSANDYEKLENGQLDVGNVSSQDLIAILSGAEGGDTEFLDPESFLARDQETMTRYGSVLKTVVEQNPAFNGRFESKNNGGYGAVTDRELYAIALGFKSEFVTGAHLNLRPGNNLTLDTHSGHKANHARGQAECWSQVVKLIEVLKSIPGRDGSSSLFDETLIMVTSEFSRETALNGGSVESAGKEHNGFTNSYLLVGGSLIGNRTIGESVIKYGELGKQSLHTARNYDFTCGEVIRRRGDSDFMKYDAFKKQILPGHIVRTLAEAFGARDLLDPTLQALPWLSIGMR